METSDKTVREKKEDTMQVDKIQREKGKSFNNIGIKCERIKMTCTLTNLKFNMKYIHT